MTRDELVKQIRKKQTYLCVGLDPDITKIPAHLQQQDDPIFEFNRQLIDATVDHCVAYKINTAFYEALGVKGWEAMEKTVNYIPPTHFKIADAKRGDIGNTSGQYAKAFFETLSFDAITVAPYMGADSIQPFLDYKNKWTIVLGLTSNPGSQDFELQKVVKKKVDLIEGVHTESTSECFLFEEVISKVSGWGSPENLMFVIGATQLQQLKRIRDLIPDNFLLVPGIGAQGGSLQEVSATCLTPDCGLLVNASRAIIFAGNDHSFTRAAKDAALTYSDEMRKFLNSHF